MIRSSGSCDRVLSQSRCLGGYSSNSPLEASCEPPHQTVGLGDAQVQEASKSESSPSHTHESAAMRCSQCLLVGCAVEWLSLLLHHCQRSICIQIINTPICAEPRVVPQIGSSRPFDHMPWNRTTHMLNCRYLLVCIVHLSSKQRMSTTV